MKKIIEELYFGTINMQETINSASIPEYKEKIRQISDQELSFLKLLSLEGKEQYKKLEGMKADAMFIDYANIFKEGFRLGAKLMLEILEN